MAADAAAAVPENSAAVCISWLLLPPTPSLQSEDALSRLLLLRSSSSSVVADGGRRALDDIGEKLDPPKRYRLRNLTSTFRNLGVGDLGHRHADRGTTMKMSTRI